MPDERLGEIVGAAIVLKEGAEMTVEELRDYLAPHLATFKIPARVWFRAEQLPRIASGKNIQASDKGGLCGRNG